MKETQWSSKLVKDFRKCNALVLNIHGHEMQAPGWPDTYLCHAYWRGFIEFKGQRTTIRSIQKSIIKKLKDRGANAVVVRYPNLIQTEHGVLLGRFPLDTDNDGLALIKQLREIQDGIGGTLL